MKDRFRIDSHKLMFHVKRVADWLDKKMIYPVYMEISPCGACNHRCSFCSVDFMGYKKTFLDTELLKKRISELSYLGLKSIMFAGEGEPLLHRELSTIICHTKNSGIDVAITTNGVLLKPSLTEHIIGSVEWIKISMNAGTPETYAKIHGTKPGDFDKVLSNIEYAASKKGQNDHHCTIGVQILLIPENYNEVEILAEKVRDAGADYLVVKPYTHHYKNAHDMEIKYQDYEPLDVKLKIFTNDNFDVVFRANAMKSWDGKTHDFSKCVCLPFWSYIDSQGNVWGCSAHLLEEEFNYGSIMHHTFREIWEGKRRCESLNWVESSLDIRTCKLNCRMGQVNRYLTQLIDLPEHVNFI